MGYLFLKGFKSLSKKSIFAHLINAQNEFATNPYQQSKTSRKIQF